MESGTTSNPLRDRREDRRTIVMALERRISELEQVMNSQSRELRIQFERIAQLQAEWDTLRIRFAKRESVTARVPLDLAKESRRS